MENFKLKILIVEDDLSLAIDLEMIIEELGYNIIGQTDNSAEALEKIYSDNPDLILMDIDIKGKLTGIEIAKKIEHLNIPILFVTSFNDQEHFNAASDTNYIGYFIKPVQKFTLQSIIETTFKKIAQSEKTNNSVQEEQEAFPFKDFLFFKKRGILHKILISNILLVSADDDYTITVTKEGEFISSLRLFEIEEILKPYSFVKTHRSHIVNINKINSIDSSNNVLKIGSHEVPISRSKRNMVMEKIHFLK